MIYFYVKFGCSKHTYIWHIGYIFEDETEIPRENDCTQAFGISFVNCAYPCYFCVKNLLG